MHDLQNCKFANVLAPISVAGGATATTNDIDAKGFRDVALIIQAGAVPATGVAVLKWQESDIINSGYADIPGATHTALVDANDNVIVATFISLVGRKRFLRAVITNGATNATVLAAMAILYRAEETPNTPAERGLLEQLFV
jgi:hypothetical protein